MDELVALTTPFVNVTSAKPIISQSVEEVVFLLASAPAVFFLVAGPVRLCQIAGRLKQQELNTLADCRQGLKYAKNDGLDIAVTRFRFKIIASVFAAVAYGLRLGLTLFFHTADVAIVPEETLWYHVLDCASNSFAWIFSALVVYFEFHCLQKQNWLQLSFWWTATFLNIVAVVASAMVLDPTKEGRFLVPDLITRFLLLVPLTVMAILALFPRDIDKETILRMKQIVYSKKSFLDVEAYHHEDEGKSGYTEPSPGMDNGPCENVLHDVVGAAESDASFNLEHLAPSQQKRQSALFTSHQGEQDSSRKRLSSLLNAYNMGEEDDDDAAAAVAPTLQEKLAAGGADEFERKKKLKHGFESDIQNDKDRYTKAIRSEGDVTSDFISNKLNATNQGSDGSVRIPQTSRARMQQYGDRLSTGNMDLNEHLLSSSFDSAGGSIRGMRNNRRTAISTSYGDRTIHSNLSALINGRDTKQSGQQNEKSNHGFIGHRSHVHSSDFRNRLGSSLDSSHNFGNRGGLQGIYSHAMSGEATRRNTLLLPFSFDNDVKSLHGNHNSNETTGNRDSSLSSASAAANLYSNSEVYGSTERHGHRVHHLSVGENVVDNNNVENRYYDRNQEHENCSSFSAEQTYPSVPSPSVSSSRLSNRLPDASNVEINVTQYEEKVDEKRRKFIEYTIMVTNGKTKQHWTVKKRYSHFINFDRDLRRSLKKEGSKYIPPPLPKKASTKRKTEQVLLDRKDGLEKYLRDLDYSYLTNATKQANSHSIKDQFLILGP